MRTQTWWQKVSGKKNETLPMFLSTVCGCGHRRGNHEWMKLGSDGVPHRNPKPEGQCSQCSESCQSFNANKRK